MAKGETGMQLGCLVPALTSPPGLEGPTLAPSVSRVPYLWIFLHGADTILVTIIRQSSEKIFTVLNIPAHHMYLSLPHKGRFLGVGGRPSFSSVARCLARYPPGKMPPSQRHSPQLNSRQPPKISPKKCIRALTRAVLFTNAEAWGLE